MQPLYFFGIDIGSVSVKCALIDESGQMQHDAYLRTEGQPLVKLRQMLQEFQRLFPDAIIAGICATGSGKSLPDRYLHAATENEILCHARGTQYLYPDVQTILEIGGQDSKFITLDHEEHLDFLMNKVCAAGTGSFLEEQA